MLEIGDKISVSIPEEPPKGSAVVGNSGKIWQCNGRAAGYTTKLWQYPRSHDYPEAITWIQLLTTERPLIVIWIPDSIVEDEDA
jgi:hypothetical protein